MVNLSSGDSPGTSSPLHKFNVIMPPRPDDPDSPYPRSGHRTFVDNDFFYVIGGYTDTPDDAILRELWKFNLVTHKWTRCTLPLTFPHTLASFACHSSGNGTFMVYGGTAIPFGVDLDQTVYMGRVIGNDVQIEKIHPLGTKTGCYGHVLLFDPVRNKTFSVGGTDGTSFKLDVHALSRNEESKNWVWEEYATLADDIGVYRMEAVLENGKIYIFGGGTTQRISTFKTMYVFNIEQRLYEVIDTEADPIHGHPPGRRCHSLVQWGRHVIIAGGCYDDTRVSPARNMVLGCVWSFNLDTKCWKRMDDLPHAVYFHDASITPEGQMIIFGGVTNSMPRIRTAALQTLWLGPPSLFSSALAKVQTMKEIKGTDHVLSDRLNLTRHIYAEILPA